ncbi:MAG: DUF4336 domain-containing protein [Hyphomonadaceae bacterium]
MPETRKADPALSPVLQPLGSNIWTSDGSLVSVAGFRYPTRMAIIRLADGSLFIWSPVEADEALHEAVSALGAVKVLVAPNSLHHLALAAWKAKHPDARLLAAPGLRKRRPDLAFDGDLTESADPAWASELDQAVVHGNAITTEVVFFHRQSSTVLFTDLIQNFPKGWFKGWRGLVASLDRLVAPDAEVPQKFRVAFTDRRAAREALVRILAWPIETVVMAHGPVVRGRGHAYITRAFRWLMKGR